MPSLLCQSIEFSRFGGAASQLAPENKYICTSGWDTVSKEVSPTLDHRMFLSNLNRLRYGPARTRDAAQAQATLAAEAARFLDTVQWVDGQLLQADLVTSAAELWAFPFEAVFANYEKWLHNPECGVIITRRIRSDFSERAGPWPVTPRVLFLHAPAAADLDRTFIAQHESALRSALTPWSGGKDLIESKLLAIHEVDSVDDIFRYRDEFKPTYIHILAHGAQAPPKDPFLPQDTSWGLRLGDVGRPGAPPEDIADALKPKEGLPVVVTLAACDSGNQANPIFADRSIAQELHLRGVPVVIGSQLPLTKPGSCTLTAKFYQLLLGGQDARVALHAARVGLKSNADAGHDWLSLVGYVRLPPEGYGAYLDEVGLRVDLRLLDAAQKRADKLNLEAAGPLEVFAEIEQLVRSRLDSLTHRKQLFADRIDLLIECSGLEASAYKRLAELLFIRGSQYPDKRDGDWRASIEMLRRARDAYRTAYEANLQSHWVGVQQLALDAVLTPPDSRLGDYPIVQRAAELAVELAIRKGKGVRPGEESYWAYGTLTELSLLAPKAGRQRDLDRAKTHARKLVETATAAGEEFPLLSTRRQINRYVNWWTNEHGFFPGGQDLAGDAREILGVLS